MPGQKAYKALVPGADFKNAGFGAQVNLQELVN